LLKRVFDIDLSQCPECGGITRVIAAILLPKAVKKILNHMKLPTDPPALSPARAPPIFAEMDPFGGFDYDTLQVFT
jgi:hypothetical protein